MNKKLLIIGPVLVILMLGAFILNSSVNTTLKPGDPAPEISLNSPDGVLMELSTLKGKMVYIDFWASWCGPCRRENLNLVRLYNKFKDQKFQGADGLVIFSVSLDTDVEIWKKAIKNDKLVWPYHVSDLKKWDSPTAGSYGVTSLPAGFLVGPDGKIMATNLNGTSLEIEIEKYVVR